jgi:NarL family two-component system response regulator LiaR
MPPIRIIIVDDHKLMRTGLRAACERAPDIEVLGEAENGQQAVELVRALAPDIVLMDIKMPVLDGVAATRRIVEHNPKIAVIVLSMFDEDEHILQAINVGARGYLLKSTTNDQLLVQGIYAVAAGGVLIDPDIATRLLSNFDGVPTPLTTSIPAHTPAHETEPLSDIEVELLRYVAQGDENKHIAQAMSLSEKTVSNRLSVIYEKIHVNNRVQAALYAIQHGIAQPPTPL